MILVLGASGFIGRHIFDGLKRESISVAGTYFTNRIDGMHYFDIENMTLDEIGLDRKNITHIIISAAAKAKKIDDSKIYWERIYNTNVSKTRELIDFCFNNNIVPVYLSTDNVFDGRKGGYKEADERNPINCYGRIRYEVENILLESQKDFVILRMGKVFGTAINDATLVTDMVNDMKEGKRMVCAYDQVFTPLYIGDLQRFVKFIIESRLFGIYHLASVKPTTRYEIAMAIKKYFNFNKSDVIPCEIASFKVLDERTKLIDLDITKYKDITGFKESTIENYLSMLN